MRRPLTVRWPAVVALTLALVGAAAETELANVHAAKHGGVSERERVRIWQRPGGGMTFMLAVDPTRPGTVYAGTARGGIFVSTNRGKNWRRLHFSWQSGRITGLVVDRAGTVYAGRADGRLLESTDAGATWTVARRSPDKVEIRGLALDRRTNPMTVYAGTSAGEVIRSSDRGRTWTASGDGLEGQAVNAVAVDPRRRAGVVWAATTGGVFRSGDGGAHWRKIDPIALRELALDPTRKQTLLGTNEGVFRSSEAGKSWKRVGGVKYALSLVANSRRRPGAWYVGTSYDSVLESTDGGDTWSPANAGLSKLGEVVDLAIDMRTRPSTLYACTSQLGVNRSTDGGKSWQADEGAVPADGGAPSATAP